MNLKESMKRYIGGFVRRKGKGEIQYYNFKNKDKDIYVRGS